MNNISQAYRESTNKANYLLHYLHISIILDKIQAVMSKKLSKQPNKLLLIHTITKCIYLFVAYHFRE